MQGLPHAGYDLRRAHLGFRGRAPESGDSATPDHRAGAGVDAPEPVERIGQAAANAGGLRPRPDVNHLSRRTVVLRSSTVTWQREIAGAGEERSTNYQIQNTVG